MRRLNSTIRLATVLVALSCAPASAEERAPQLMHDPGFESLGAGELPSAGKLERGWEAQRSSRQSINRSLRIDVLGEKEAKSGSRCVALSIPQNTVGFEYVTIGQRHRLKVDAEYEASVWVRWSKRSSDSHDAPPSPPGGSAIASFWVRHRDGKGHFAGRDVWIRDHRWRQLKFRFRTTEEKLPALIYLSLLPHQKPVATTLFVDDFELKELPDAAQVDLRRHQLVLDSDFSKQDQKQVHAPWHFANLNGNRILGVVEGNAEQKHFRMKMGKGTSNFQSAQLWQHLHLMEGAKYAINCQMRWDNFEKDESPPIINFGIYHEPTNTWYGPIDQVLSKSSAWHTYRFTHAPTESGPWKLYVQVNGWGNFGKGVSVSIDNFRCQQREIK